jgi:hypothetical protein
MLPGIAETNAWFKRALAARLQVQGDTVERTAGARSSCAPIAPAVKDTPGQTDKVRLLDLRCHK